MSLVTVVFDLKQLGVVLDVARVELALQEVRIAHDVDQEGDVLQRRGASVSRHNAVAFQIRFL